MNLNKECPFWADDSKCAMKDCAVDVCTEVGPLTYFIGDISKISMRAV